MRKLPGKNTIEWVKNNTFTGKDTAEIWGRKLEKKMKRILRKNPKITKKNIG